MKKIIFTIFALVPSITYGESCPVSTPPESLIEYIQKTEVMAGKIIEEISQTEGNMLESGRNYSVSMTAAFDSSLTWWDSFGTDFQYFLMAPYSGVDYPEEINRDYFLIANLSNALEQQIRSLTLRGVDTRVDFEDETLFTLYNTNEKLLKYFKRTVLVGTGKRYNNLPSTFAEVDLSAYRNAVTLCENTNEEEKGFLETIDEITSNLFSPCENGSCNDWEVAWELLNEIGGSELSQTYVLEQREILHDYLRNQGASINGGANLLENVDENTSNNGSFIDGLLERLTPVFHVEEIGREVLNEFSAPREPWETIPTNEPQDTSNVTVTFADLSVEQRKSESIAEIRVAVNQIYEVEKSRIGNQNITTNRLIDRLQKVHIVLAEGIETLEKTTPLSERLCGQQWQGQWICRY